MEKNVVCITVVAVIVVVVNKHSLSLLGSLVKLIWWTTTHISPNKCWQFKRLCAAFEQHSNVFHGAELLSTTQNTTSAHSDTNTHIKCYFMPRSQTHVIKMRNFFSFLRCCCFRKRNTKSNAKCTFYANFSISQSKMCAYIYCIQKRNVLSLFYFSLSSHSPSKYILIHWN